MKLKQQSYPIWLMVYNAWSSVTAAATYTFLQRERCLESRLNLKRFQKVADSVPPNIYIYQTLTKETNGHDLRLQISEISYLFVVTCEFSYVVAVLCIEIFVPFSSHMYIYTWISDRNTYSNSDVRHADKHVT